MEHFENANISPESLPSISNLSFQPIEQRFVKANLVVNLTASTLLLIIAIITANVANGKIKEIAFYACFVLPIIGAFYTALCYASDKNKAYAVRELDISFRSGVVFVNTVTQPILRIQHVEINKGPIERKLGLATLLLFSAGGSSYTFAIPGLDLAQAEQLRQFILDHKATIQAG